MLARTPRACSRKARPRGELADQAAGAAIPTPVRSAPRAAASAATSLSSQGRRVCQPAPPSRDVPLHPRLPPTRTRCARRIPPSAPAPRAPPARTTPPHNSNASSRRASASSRLIACQLLVAPQLAPCSPPTSAPAMVWSYTFSRHRERVPVLAAVRQREPRRVGEPARRPVQHLGHHAPAPAPSARPTPGTSSSSVKSFGPRSAAAARLPCSRRSIDVLRPHLVMRPASPGAAASAASGGGTARRRSRASSAGQLARDRRPAPARRSSSSCAARDAAARRSVRLTIVPCPCAFDRRVRRVDEARSGPPTASGSAAPARPRRSSPAAPPPSCPSSVTMKPWR